MVKSGYWPPIFSGPFLAAKMPILRGLRALLARALPTTRSMITVALRAAGNNHAIGQHDTRYGPLPLALARYLTRGAGQ